MLQLYESTLLSRDSEIIQNVLSAFATEGGADADAILRAAGAVQMPADMAWLSL